MASILEVIRPTDVATLLPILSDPGCNPRVLAGGTDLLLKYPHDDGPDLTIVDISGIASLAEIVAEEDGLRIGAAVRLVDIIKSETVAERLPVLREGAGVVAGPQIRNLATLGGNVCNASPSADTVTPLLVLGADARIRSARGLRSVPLADFFVGPGRTVLESGEFLEALWIPWPVAGTVASYTKVSPRRAMDLAVVGIAVSLWREPPGLQSRIGLGAVAPTPLRAVAAEARIVGAIEMTADLAREAGSLAAAAASPIDDVRASASYRKKVVERLVARSLMEVYERMSDGAG